MAITPRGYDDLSRGREFDSMAQMITGERKTRLSVRRGIIKKCFFEKTNFKAQRLIVSN